MRIKHHKSGIIKDFSVPDAHTLYVTVSRFVTKLGMVYEEILKREAFVIPEVDVLDHLHKMVDPEDGYVMGQKWNMTDEVIKELKSKGEAKSEVFSPHLMYAYYLRQTLHADNLRHKG